MMKLFINSWNAMTLQDGASPLMEQLIFFNDHMMFISFLIITFIGYALFILMINPFTNLTLIENQLTELIWTIIPAVTLLLIALPSLSLLYLLDEVNDPMLTIKAVGHQWYWSYEYSDFADISFDSYPLVELDSKNSLRLLETDNHTIIPMLTQIRLIVTAADVIHSWTVPALGVKVDAVPGRLNQLSFSCLRPGLFYGQCSEICGANHSFMPITIESVPMNTFLTFFSKD